MTSNTAAPILAPLPALASDINDGFRRPDLAWVLEDPNAFAEVGGDLVFSNFWTGPREAALAFAQQLAGEFHAWAQTVVAADPSDPPEILVGYWEAPDQPWALVGILSLTEDFLLMDDTVPEGFASIRASAEQGLWRVANDGNDNSPEELISGIDEAAQGEPPMARKQQGLACGLMLAIAPDEQRKELADIINELDLPISKPKRPTSPKAT